ncbi:MAG: DNA primase [Leptolyngbya sp. PLA3]|nr:MAG: DNA primase [Cyanobacteria bacterium CYA]MCE7968637.1 DNA primase [Leptolyngbya sp. PL-A3]
MSLDARNDDKQRVKEASDIVDLVGSHVSLKPRGREFVGLCPFHDDHTPSMAVIPHKQIFYCHACGTGGDVFSFVQKYHRMDFRASLEYLAQRAGIELRPPAPSRRGSEGPTTGDIAEANHSAHAFFRAVLNHPEHGRGARAVIARRGISREMVDLFELGAAPPRPDGLMLKLGGAPRVYLDAGLIKEREGRRYDAFRNRVIFPIHDQMGRVVAFGARRIDDADEPKYLNSPETAIFHKSDTLYGLKQAARAIQRERHAVIVEGYTDVIACHQAGMSNVVGTLGTALTPGHARVLRRLCDRVVLLFDGDEAGQRAADRAVNVFFDESIDVSIATLSSVTDAKDPDELLKRQGGLEALRSAIASGVDLLEFRFAKIRSAWSQKGPAALNRALTEEIRVLADLGLGRLEPKARGLIIRRLHELTGLEAQLISGAVSSAGRRGSGSAREESSKPDGLRVGKALSTGESVLGCLLIEPKLWRLHSGCLDLLPTEQSFERPETQCVAGRILGLVRAGADPSLELVLDMETRPEVQAAAVALASATETQTDHNPARVAVLFEDCLARLWAVSPGAAGPKNDVEESLSQRLERERALRQRLGQSARSNPWRARRTD